jgi:hypothetical protein
MTIYKVGCKISDAAMDIEYIDAEDEESAAMIYDRIYRNIGYCTEFFVKKLGLFSITTHVVRMRILPSGVKYKTLRKSWRPFTWLN